MRKHCVAIRRTDRDANDVPIGYVCLAIEHPGRCATAGSEAVGIASTQRMQHRTSTSLSDLAVEETTSRMRFLHCSDVHITQAYEGIPPFHLGWRRSLALFELGIGGRAAAFRGADQALRQIVRDADYLAADHILISGDLTAYATPLEFQAARDALGSAADNRARCSIIPGNHDCYTPDAVRDKRFEQQFSHLLSSDLPEYCREGPYPFIHMKGDDAAVVGLNSARVTAFPGLAYGRIGDAQLRGLRDMLQDARLAGKAVLVMVHHGPFTASGQPDSRMHGLVDADRLLNLLPGPRFAVLHGHIHHRFHHPATVTRPHIFCAGSSTQRGREGYWIIDVKDGQIAEAAMHVPRSPATR